jgi:hypothetical protein
MGLKYVKSTMGALMVGEVFFSSAITLFSVQPASSARVAAAKPQGSHRLHRHI